MPYLSHRLRVQEKKAYKKFIWSIIYMILAVILAVFVGLPVLAKIAIGISLLRGSEKTVNETTSFNIFAPVIEPLASATNSGMITITGYSESERKIIVSVNNRIDSSAETDKEGKFRIAGIKLNIGENKIEVVAEQKEVKSQAAEFYITYRKEAPKLEINEPSDGQTISGEANIKISGATDVDVKVSINGRLIIVDRNGNFSYPITLSSGENVFSIQAEDDAGNTKQMELKVNYSP